MKLDDSGWPGILAARTVIKDHEIKSLPVDPIVFAKTIDIEVIPKDASSPGVSGMLLRVGNHFGIAYATHIDSPGFQNFSVAHELGHFFIPGHIDAVLAHGEVHESRAGFRSSDRYEVEADHFAANFLMPEGLFSKEIDQTGEGLGAVENLANLCVTSLTATAIRYIQCAGTPAAMVVSTGDRVDYCFMSAPLKEADGLEWIRKGQSLPSNTATARLNKDSDRILAGERTADTCGLQDWFGSDLEVEMTEEVVGLGNYDKTLTILTPKDMPDPEDIEEEEEMLESWKPRFRR